MAEPEQTEAERDLRAMAERAKHLALEDWRILLEGAQTGTLPSASGVTEAGKRFWHQWLQSEGLLTCPYCGVEFATTEEYDEHEKWEC